MSDSRELLIGNSVSKRARRTARSLETRELLLGLDAQPSTPVAPLISAQTFSNSTITTPLADDITGVIVTSSRDSAAIMKGPNSLTAVEASNYEPAVQLSEGLQVAGEATNLTVNSGWVYTVEGIPTGWSRSSSVYQDVSSVLPDSAFTLSVPEAPIVAKIYFPTVATAVTAGQTFTFSVQVEYLNAAYVFTAEEHIGSYFLTGSGTVTFPACEANPTGGATGVLQLGLLYVHIDVTTTGTLRTQVGTRLVSSVNGDLNMSMPQLTEGDYPKPFILTPTGAGATRLVDGNTDSVLANYPTDLVTLLQSDELSIEIPLYMRELTQDVALYAVGDSILASYILIAYDHSAGAVTLAVDSPTSAAPQSISLVGWTPLAMHTWRTITLTIQGTRMVLSLDDGSSVVLAGFDGALVWNLTTTRSYGGDFTFLGYPAPECFFRSVLWRDVGPSGIPDFAEAYYDFSLAAGEAGLEQVVRQVSITTKHDADINVPQLDGTVVTVEQGGLPLVVGESVLIEAIEATNPILYPTDFTNAAWTKRGASSAVVSSMAAPKAGQFMDLITFGASGVDDIFQPVVGVYSVSTKLSPCIYINKASATGIFNINQPNGAGLYGKWEVDLDQLPSSTICVNESSNAVTVLVPFISNTSGNGGMQLASQTGTKSFYVWGANVKEEDYPSSVILNTSTPETRDPVIAEIDTKLELGVLLETPENSTVYCLSGDITTGDGELTYLNGVRESPFSLLFTGSVAVKYLNAATANQVGAVITCASGDIVRITAVSPANQWNLELLSGTLDSAATSLRNDPFSINWNRSSYPEATKEADVLALRQAAGDTGSFPAVVPWAGSGWKLTFDMEFQTDHPSINTTFTETRYDTNNRIYLARVTVGNFFSQITTSDGSFAMSNIDGAPMENGDRFTFAITYNGAKFTSQVDSGLAAEKAATGTFIWEDVLHIASNHFGTQFENMKVYSLTYEEL